MNRQRPRSFYVGLFKEGSEYIGHGISVNPAKLSIPDDEEDTDAALVPTAPEMNFKSVFSSFVTVMETYRKFIPIVLGIAPLVSSLLTQRNIGRVARDKAKLRSDLSTDK